MRLLVGLCCLIVCIGINSLFKYRPEEMGTSPLPIKEAALILSGEFNGLASDYFLVQGTVFYGSKTDSMNPEDRKWLAKDLELSSYLDPYYFEPYWMAAVVLPWEGEAKAAISLLKKGHEFIRKNWQIPFFLGFIYFYFEHDNQQASQYLFEASKLPGAPSYLPLLAARLAAKGGETKVAIYFLKKELKAVKDLGLRKRIQKRLKALEIIDFLEQAVKRYNRLYDQYPRSLEELVKKGIIAHIPPDPYGGRFYITKEGRVWSTSNLR